jgi:hypothetical protein
VGPARTRTGRALDHRPPQQQHNSNWQRQINNWQQVAQKFNITADRYEEFKYLCYLDITDHYVVDYVNFHLHGTDPDFTNRLKASLLFWIELGTPQWLLEYIDKGVTVPFASDPPRMFLNNHTTVLEPSKVNVVRGIIAEYLAYGFVKQVTTVPHCVLPLQIKESPDKVALIYDMSKLNDYVNQSKFKLESWPEMFHYAASSNFAIKFDMKKFYHQVAVNTDFQTYFGFKYDMGSGTESFFVWATLPYGYTRAPFIARQLMKPLIVKWRKLGAKTVVFYDDGMAVSHSYKELCRLSVQMQCDLLRAGLVPGVKKCIWSPVQRIDWNGLTFDFVNKGMSIKIERIEKLKENLAHIMDNWPALTYRQVAQCTGRINSMYPVLGENLQIRTKMLQTIVNIRHYKNQSWDHLIDVDYIPLYFHAFAELEYWLSKIDSKNFVKFIPDKPQFVGWTDASNVALAGCVIQLHREQKLIPVTIDNVLLNARGVYHSLRKHVALCVDENVWQYTNKVPIRDFMDSLVEDTEEMFICHRNLSPEEQATSSTEREMLAIYHTVLSLAVVVKGKMLTLHTDSQNAQIICTKGSPKPKLQAYAKLIHDLLDSNGIILNVVWIPRDLNIVADFISTEIDYGDYEVLPAAFENLCNTTGRRPDVDCFANDYNAKCKKFFSPVWCPNTSGVNAFNYDWSVFELCWIFVQPSLISRALNYAQKCLAHVLVLVPQWKNSAFYPQLLDFKSSSSCKNVWIFDGANMFSPGFDINSVFSERYNGNVELWEFKFDY